MGLNAIDNVPSPCTHPDEKRSQISDHYETLAEYCERCGAIRYADSMAEDRFGDWQLPELVKQWLEKEAI